MELLRNATDILFKYTIITVTVQMDFISRRFKKNDYQNVTYPVYTEEEANNKEIEYKSWRECQVGDFGLSDDGYVSECIYRKKFKNNEQVTFPYGRQWLSEGGKLKYIPHRETGQYTQVGVLTWDQQEANKTRTKNAVKLYAEMMLNGDSINWEVIGKAYRKDQERPDLTAKRLFKKESIQKMLDKEIQKALSDRNITQGDVLDILLEGIGVAKENKDASNILRGAEQFIKILDMLPKKSMQTDTVQIDMTNTILDKIATEEKKSLKMSQKKEVYDEPYKAEEEE